MPENNFKNASDLAPELGVSVQTLKNWARDFSPFLSPAGAMGDNARRFSDDDVTVLRRIKDHLAAGLTFEETADELRQAGVGNGFNQGDPPGGALAVTSAQQGFSVLTDTLRAMIENQQTIQNSLQVNRNLLGVIIQDNFNLKEEIAKLRERMLKLEQDLAELKKRDSDYRLYLEQRLNHMDQALRAEASKGIFQKLLGG